MVQIKEPANKDIDRSLAELADASANYIAVVDATTYQVIYLNASFRRILGIGESDPVTGIDYLALHAAEDREALLTVQFPGAVREHVWRGEGVILGKEKKFAVFRSIAVHRDADGIVRYFSTVSNDLTEKKVAEEELHKNYALISTIFNQTVSLMGLMKPDGTVLKINPVALSVVNKMEAEVAGKLFWETPWWSHSPEQQQRLRDAVKRAAQGEFVRFEATHPKAGGGLVYVDFSIKPVKNEKGEVILLVPEGRDITERVKQEEQLHIQQLQQFAIMDNVPDLMWMKDGAGVYLAVNKAFLAIVGKQREEVIGKTDFDVFLKGYAELHQAYDKEVAESGKQRRMEETVIDTKGNVIWLETIKSPVYDSEGKLIGVAGVGRDITERRRIRSLVKKYTDRL